MAESTEDTFANWLKQLQSGDSTTIANFVERYEPYIRRTIRYRLNQSSLWTVADSVDVCQSVLGGFLLRLFAGDYELDSEQDLQKLLAGIAKKKFLMLQRKELAAKRSRRLTQSLTEFPELAAEPSSTAEFFVELQELQESVNQLLSQEEVDLLRRRKLGQNWSDIALELQIDPVLLRKRLSRALRRVADELGLEF